MLGHVARPLRQRDFRWMFGGTLLSTALQWVQSATLGWLIYDISGSGAVIGLVLGVRVLPVLLLSPLAGLVADRYERLASLSITQLFLAVPSFLIALSIALDAIAIWQLVLYTLVTGGAATFDRTLRNAVVFDIVPREDMASGAALMNVAFSVSRAIGPVIAGGLIAYAGAAWCFAVLGGLALAVILSLRGLQARPALKRAQRGSAWQEMKDGLRYGLSDPIARLMLLLMGVTGMFLIPVFGVLVPIFAADVFRVGPQGLGLMLGAVGVGAVLGSLLAALLSRYDRLGRVQSLSVLAFAVSLILFAFSPGVGTALVPLAVGGACEMMILTSTATAMQLAAPEPMRGRVAALIAMFPVSISSGMLLAGWFSDLMRAPWAALLLAALALVILAAAWQRSRVLRELRLSRLIQR